MKVHRVPKYSIVMPTYNVSEHIFEAVGSILAQSVTDWELVLSDDASTDGTSALLSQLAYADARISVINSEKNSGGAYIPRVRAARQARGEYIVTIDADDVIDSDYLQRISRKLDACDADLVVTEMWRLAQSETPHKILPPPDFDTEKIYVGKELVRHTLKGWKISMNGFACRRDIYLSACENITDDDLCSIHADELLSRWILFLSRQVLFAPSRYFYRVNGDSVTHNYTKLIKGASLTNVGLKRMCSDCYGTASVEYRLANEQLFLGAVDSLRRITAGHFRPDEKTELFENIKASLSQLDYKAMGKGIGKLYRSIMFLPLPWARRTFMLLDTVKRLIKP